jgi:alcohol dehydrogenase (cytochrome c)
MMSPTYGFGMSLEEESMLSARRSFVVIAAIAASSLAMLAPLSGQRDQSPPPQAPIPAVLRGYQPVTADRLKNPEDSNWLMVRRTYDGWGYSPLDQITPANVNRLRPVWVFSTGEARVHESPPIVNNGAMFVTTPNGQVIAIDAKSGTLLWRYRRPRPPGALVPHETNRGVAL